MSNWCCLVKIWNENDHIKETLLAIEGYFDKIIVLDGAWSYYPYKVSKDLREFYSTDGSIEAVLDVATKMPEIFLGVTNYVTEVDKLNTGIKLMDMKDGDYIVFLDGHEIMEGDFLKQRGIIENEAWDIGKVIIYNPINHPPEKHRDERERLKKFHSQWRILRYHPQLHLRNKHWNFNINKHGFLDDKVPDTYGVCDHIQLQHLQRNKERERIRDIFKQSMSRSRWHEDDHLQWRMKQNIRDGKV